MLVKSYIECSLTVLRPTSTPVFIVSFKRIILSVMAYTALKLGKQKLQQLV